MSQSDDHGPQTIYRKTEMFDDAIKRVLRVTPYACINELKKEIQKKLGLQLAKETLIRRLKNLDYVYTKFTLDKKDPGNDSLELNQLRHNFVKIYRENLSNFPVFFYGACHISVDECRGSMWIKTKQDNGEGRQYLKSEDKPLDHLVR